MRERLGQDLDRDVAIQLRVARAKDLAHAAFADRRSDLVDAEAGAGSEGQSAGLYGWSRPLGLLLENAVVTICGAPAECSSLRDFSRVTLTANGYHSVRL